MLRLSSVEDALPKLGVHLPLFSPGQSRPELDDSPGENKEHDLRECNPPEREKQGLYPVLWVEETVGCRRHRGASASMDRKEGL